MNNAQQLRAATYLRVSRDDEKQTPKNQIKPLLAMAQNFDYRIAEEYIDRASGGSANRPEFQRMLADAKMKKFDVILVWSLDRFSREGIGPTLAYIKQLRSYGVILKSHQEAWVDSLNDEFIGEMMISFVAWFGEFERRRISDRTKSAMSRLADEIKTNGSYKTRDGKIILAVGRPKGATDRKPRKRRGYFLRYNS